MPDLRPPVSGLVFGLTTTADKIRALDRAGYTRSEIAKHLVIRYQQVRNVLEDDKMLGRGNMPLMPPRDLAEAPRPFETAPQTARRITVGPNGEVQIPQYMLDAIGAKEGDALLVRIVDEAVQLRTPETALRRVQESVRQYIPQGVSLADELIAERHAEAERELGDE